MHNIMGINRAKYPNQFFLDFDEENQFIVNINGCKPLYHLSDLIRLRDMVETSIQTYLSEEISDEIVDSDNDEYVQEYSKSFNGDAKKNEKRNFPIAYDYLYLFIDTNIGKLKIGRTGNPRKRLKSLQYEFDTTLKSLFELEDYGKTEKYVLEKFSKYRLHGEWFSYQQEIVDYFATLKSNQENGI